MQAPPPLEWRDCLRHSALDKGEWLGITIISILIHSSKVHSILQEDRADGGQVLLGSEMEGGLAVLG